MSKLTPFPRATATASPQLRSERINASGPSLHSRIGNTYSAIGNQSTLSQPDFYAPKPVLAHSHTLVKYTIAVTVLAAPLAFVEKELPPHHPRCTQRAHCCSALAAHVP